MFALSSTIILRDGTEREQLLFVSKSKEVLEQKLTELYTAVLEQYAQNGGTYNIRQENRFVINVVSIRTNETIRSYVWDIDEVEEI